MAAALATADPVDSDHILQPPDDTKGAIKDLKLFKMAAYIPCSTFYQSSLVGNFRKVTTIILHNFVGFLP